MKVLHLSASDLVGGAARAAFRLHVGLQKLGLDSRMIVRTKRSRNPDITRFEPASNLIARALRFWRFLAAWPTKRMIERVVKEPEWMFSEDRTRFREDLVRGYDVVNLHWVARFIDLPSFFANIPNSTHVVWTLHDMNSFTGGCHYDYGCARHTQECGRCPALQSSRENDLSRATWLRKAAVFGQFPPHRLHIVTPSRWLTQTARNSSLFRRFSVQTIPYGLDTDDFFPRDQAEARRVLGLPPGAMIILFVATNVDDPRKGAAFVAKAVETLDCPNVLLLCVGQGFPPSTSRHRCLHLRNLSNYSAMTEGGRESPTSDRLLSLVYSAADVLALASTAENLAQTALEAISCGLPVVGLNVGGTPDIVRSGETGFLVEGNDVMSFSRALEQILADSDLRRRMGNACRNAAMKEYATNVQAAAYASLYRQITNSS